MRWRCRQPCDGGATGTAVAGMALSLCMRHFITMLCNFVADVVPARSTVRDLVFSARTTLAGQQQDGQPARLHTIGRREADPQSIWIGLAPPV